MKWSKYMRKKKLFLSHFHSKYPYILQLYLICNIKNNNEILLVHAYVSVKTLP